MEDDDNDFEVASCIGACGRLLGSPYKPGRPLIEPEPVEEEELQLNADHFEVHQVGLSVRAVHENVLGSFYLRALARVLAPSPAADVPSRVASSTVLPCVRQRSAAPGHRFSPRRHCYVSSSSGHGVVAHCLTSVVYVAAKGGTMIIRVGAVAVGSDSLANEVGSGIVCFVLATYPELFWRNVQHLSI